MNRYIACRDVKKAEEAKKDILATTQKDASKVRYLSHHLGRRTSFPSSSILL